MTNVELLAPAGNFECLKAAVNNGANAVYLGGKNFSARAFANNFDNEELKEAIRYAHLRNVKVYVTLNTLLTDNEFNNAIKMADFYYENNVDALLIQDLGLFYYLKNKYPDFDLHCSTQMHVHNIAGIQNAKKLGFSRVVLARESSLELIKEACKQDIEVETFVHGAICVSYSGQCLMSSYSKNRSANKGMCAQCCRLRYDLEDENHDVIETDTKYLLSPKDMYLLDDIPDLIDAGVSCFKIEGRMKSSAYVGYVTSLYRKAIDSYYENKKFELSKSQEDNLKVLFNRNFTNGLLRNKNNLFGQKTPNHLGIEIGEVTDYKDGHTYFRLSKPINQFDGIRIGDFGCNVNMLYKNGLLTNKGEINDVVSIKTDKKLSGKVYKTQDYLLEESINSIPDKKLPIDFKINITADKPVDIEMKCNDIIYNYQSDVVALKAKNAPLNSEIVTKQFNRLNDTVYYLNNIEVITEDAFLTTKMMNDIRKQAIESFDSFRLNSFKRNIHPNNVIYNDVSNEIHNDNMIEKDNLISVDNNDYYIDGVINPESEYKDNNYKVISEFGGLLQNTHKIGYYTLNICNSYGYEFLKRLGFEYIILSSELNEYDINCLIDSYEKRLNKTIYPYVLGHGKRVLMYIKSNPFEKYINNDSKHYLNDGNNAYEIVYKANHIELLEPENIDFKPNNDKVRQLIIKQ